MIEKSILKLYQPADRFLSINENDPDMQKIDVPLPECPPWELIDGYGLVPDKQVFKRPTIPDALLRIQKDSDSISQAWETLDLKRKELKVEVEWLRRMTYYCTYGYWFFNNGKPTYITPAHFRLLAFIRLNVGLPQYRDRGRKYHVVCEWILNYTFDFKEKNFDDKGERLPNKYGDELEDLGERTLFGLCNPKGRRLTATTDALAWVIHRASTSTRMLEGIQGYDAKSSKEPYLELVKMFRTQPFFLLPEFNKDAETSLKLRRTDGGAFDDMGLQTTIEPAVTGFSGHFDGREVHTFIGDEWGKKTNERMSMAWGTVKNTLAWSDDKVIRGFCIFPSNSGEYKKGGGREYLQFIRDSDYYTRKANGRTKTGCITLFLGSDQGAQGYIDKHGNSLTDKAKHHFLSNRQHYLIENTPESIQRYNKDLREHPLYLMECFTTEGGELGFDPLILDKRINEINFGKKETVMGEFLWSDGFGSAVEFKENPFGNFEISELLPKDKTNLKYMKNGTWFPANASSYMHTSDPYNYEETESKKQSKGAIVGIKRRLYSSNDETDISKWTTPDIPYTYMARPGTVDEFAEECLKVTLYYGGLHSPESNNPRIRDLFKKWGYSGYLYFFRQDDGTFKKTPGYVKTGGTGEILITHAVKYIKLHGHRVKHLNLLLQCKEFRGIEDITRLDSLAAFSGACMSIENDYRSEEQAQRSGFNIGKMFNMKHF